MPRRAPKKRNAWLITWEAVPEYRLKDLCRPRVVAILKPQLSSGRIKKLLPILFTSECRLTFSEKMAYSLFSQEPGWLHEDFQGRISCGKNPQLWARLVKDLYVECHQDAWDHETLHWTEFPRYEIDPNTLRKIEAHPEQHCSEDVFFEALWDGHLDVSEDAKAD